MSIRIETEKVIVRGVPMWKVVSVSALKYNDLPVEYVMASPSVWVGYSGGLDSKEKTCLLLAGINYRQEEIEEALGYVRRAGQRLNEINQRIAKIRETHHGTETFVV